MASLPREVLTNTLGNLAAGASWGAFALVVGPLTGWVSMLTGIEVKYTLGWVLFLTVVCVLGWSTISAKVRHRKHAVAELNAAFAAGHRLRKRSVDAPDTPSARDQITRDIDQWYRETIDRVYSVLSPSDRLSIQKAGMVNMRAVQWEFKEQSPAFTIEKIGSIATVDDMLRKVNVLLERL